MEIGSRSESYYFKGYIDNFQVYERALSKSQLDLLYANKSYILSKDETVPNNFWRACLTVTDGELNTTSCSNEINITFTNDFVAKELVGLPKILNGQEHNISFNITIFVNSTGEINYSNVSIALLENGTLYSVKYVNLTSNETNVSLWWNAISKGNYSLTVRIDYNNTYEETNDTGNGTELEWNASNNQISSWVYVNSSLWAIVYGNITGKIYLGDNSYTFHQWQWNGTNATIYAFNSDITVNWSSLLAVGKKTDNSSASNDFVDADYIINSTYDVENINRTYSIDGSQAKNTSTFYVSGRRIDNVPIMPSTECSTNLSDCFTTGILWDSSSDTNGELDQVDKENIIFISNMLRNHSCTYANTCDYEMRIPGTLDDYTGTSGTITLYVELN